MTSFVLSQNTKNLIDNAVAHGPGPNNTNYIQAYNAIYSELTVQPASANIASNVINWFSQAWPINGQGLSPSPAGTWIWNYTQGAAAAQGANVTYQLLQTASNVIAKNVFLGLQSSGYTFDDHGNFSIKSIVENDAGAGLQVIKDAFPSLNLTNAIWGGTLFAATQLGDPTYFSDYSINLTPGSSDCRAIEQGFVAASAADVAKGYIASSAINVTSLDINTIYACLQLSSTGTGVQYAALPSSGSIGILPIANNTSVPSPGSAVATATTNANGSYTITTENPSPGVNTVVAQYASSGRELDSTTYTPSAATIDSYDVNNGDINYQAVYNTGGALVQTFYDTENQDPWSSLTNTYLSAAGTEKTSTSTINHDGSSQLENFNPSTGAWTSNWTFSAAGMAATAQVATPDGSYSEYAWNPGGQGGWTGAATMYSASGRTLGQDVWTPNGTYVSTFDTSNGQVEKSVDFLPAGGYTVT